MRGNLRYHVQKLAEIVCCYLLLALKKGANCNDFPPRHVVQAQAPKGVAELLQYSLDVCPVDTLPTALDLFSDVETTAAVLALAISEESQIKKEDLPNTMGMLPLLYDPNTMGMIEVLYDPLFTFSYPSSHSTVFTQTLVWR